MSAKDKAAEYMVAARNAQMFQDVRELISTLTDPNAKCPGRHLEAQRVLPLLDSFLGEGYTGRVIAFKRAALASSDAQADGGKSEVIDYKAAYAKDMDQRLAKLNTAPQAECAPRDALTELERIAYELRAYNPAADEYKGEHICKVWAREIDSVIEQAAKERQ